MAQPVAYRVPRRFITPPQEPPPYGLLALSFAGHVLFFLGAVILSAYVSTRINQSRIYIVNLVPGTPALGSPAPRVVEPPPVSRPARAPEPAAVKTPPPKIEERTPPRPPRVETPPPRPSTPPEPLAPPRTPDVPRVTPVRPTELVLPRRAEKEAPVLDTPSARERLVEPALAPPPPRTTPPPAPPPPRVPEPPRIAAPQAPPVPTATVTSGRSGVETMRLGRPTAALPTTGSIRLDVADFPFTYYLRQIQAKISERWAPPRAAAAGGERAVIMFEIGRDGQLREPSLERSSGNTLYDQAALRAVTEASPFPPLPPEFKDSSLRVHFGFEFQPDKG